MEQVGLLVAMALGWTWVEWAWSAANWRPRWAGWLVNASLGAGVGVGVASTLYFVLVWLGIGNGWVAVGLNGVLLVAVGWMVRRRRLEGRAVAGAGEWSGNWVLGLVTVVLLVGAGGAVVKMSEATPHGDWDAWAIWNLKAKFLAAAGGEDWKRAMSPLMGESKPDYPLLLPGAVALGWRLKGESTTAGGQAVAWVMGGAVGDGVGAVWGRAVELGAWVGASAADSGGAGGDAGVGERDTGGAVGGAGAGVTGSELRAGAGADGRKRGVSGGGGATAAGAGLASRVTGAGGVAAGAGGSGKPG